MTLGIMQPYFFPYIGYFQLMNAVDEFVVYDNIEFSKGWINRNRILVNGKDVFITVPLKKDSDYLQVVQRSLADSWSSERVKMLNKIKETYRKAPFFNSVFPLVEDCFQQPGENLFDFLLYSLSETRNHLGIQTPLVASSRVQIDHELKADSKVMAIAKSRNADRYINPIGGVELYSKEKFREQGIDLQFLKANEINYRQFSEHHVPWLSIIDVMMFNSKNDIKEFLKQYTLK